MKQDIILAGVGGQGILSIATIIGEAARHWSTIFCISASDNPYQRRDRYALFNRLDSSGSLNSLFWESSIFSSSSSKEERYLALIPML